MAAPALALAAGACNVGPDYAEPVAVTPPAQFHGVGEGGATTERPDPAFLATWWTSFGDPALDSLVTRAVAGNLDLRVAEARIREARAKRGVVAADAFPTVDAVGSYERRRQSAGQRNFAGGALETDLFQAGFDASWEIDVFGKVRRSVESADAGVDSAVEQQRDALVTLLAEVARNYVEVRTFQRRRALTADNLRSQEEGVSLSRSRFRAGLTSELDVKQAESLAASTEAQIPSLEAGERQAAHRLAVLCGLEPGALLDELRSAAPIPSAPPRVDVGVPSELLRRRPDIRRAERELAGATANIGVATADLFPRFSITGSFGFAADSVGELFNADSRVWHIGPSVRWNVLDAWRIRSNIAVQDARAEAALIGFEQTVLTALEETENALVAYSHEQTRRDSLARAVAASREALAISNELYTRGLTDYLNVLDSQRAALTAEDDLAQSDRAVTANLIALYKALGGGWDTAQTNRESEASIRPVYTGASAGEGRTAIEPGSEPTAPSRPSGEDVE